MDDFKIQQVPDPQQPATAPTPAPIPAPATPVAPPPTDPLAGIPSFNPGGGGFYSKNKWYIWAGIVGLLVIGILGFFAFRPQKAEPTKKAKVELTFDASDTAPTSGEMVYKIKVANQDSVKLVDVELQIRYDDGLSYVSSTPNPSNVAGTTFRIPDLPAGVSAPVIIKTAVQGDINEELRLVAKLNYKYENFNSTFSEEKVHTVRLAATDVSLDMTGPDNISSAQVASYSVFFQNKSDKDIPDAKIQISYPSGFAYTEANPKPSSGQNTWNIGRLTPGQDGKIVFQGSFKNARAGGGYTFVVDFQAPDENNKDVTQATIKHETQIVDQPLAIEQRVVGGASGDLVNPGDTLSFELKFKNNTQTVATGVNVVAQIDSVALDLPNIRAEGGLVQDSTITWNASSDRALERVGPGDSGTLRFTLPLKNPATAGSQKELSVVSRIKIKSNENLQFLPGNELSLKITSPSSIEGYAGIVGGTIPPQVGQTSTFKVNVELSNSTNDFSNSTLVGYVPIGVSVNLFTVTPSEQGNVRYDASTGKLTWTIGQLPAHSGNTAPQKKLGFDVSFTPSISQVNNSVSLFRSIVFSGKDTFTGQSISLQGSEVRSDSVPGAEDQGRVRN